MYKILLITLFLNPLVSANPPDTNKKAPINDTGAISVHHAQQDSNADNNLPWFPFQEYYSDYNRLRQEANNLKSQAEKLYSMADQFQDETDKVDRVIKDLEKEVDDLEDESQALLKQSVQMQQCLKLSTIDEPESYLIQNPDRINKDSSSTEESELAHDQNIQIHKMRQSADQLLTKAQKIAITIREMGESAEAKNDLADKFEIMAKELELKASEIEKLTDKIEKEMTSLPLQVRFPLQLGQQIRFTSIAPYENQDLHILIMSGFNFSLFINPFLVLGIEDITLYFNETMVGTRVAVTSSPYVSSSLFLTQKYEFGGGLGLALQGHLGAHKSSSLAVAPFLKLFNQNWITNRFSIGPVVKINFLAYGSFYTRSLPPGKTKQLSPKSWWVDLGITYKFHF